MRVYEKPDEIKTPEERALVDWEEYRIWNGREFFYNKKTKARQGDTKSVRTLTLRM